MSWKKDPTASLNVVREKAVGFFLDSWKRIQKPRASVSQKGGPGSVAVDLGHSHVLLLSVRKTGEKPEISHFRLEARPADSGTLSERLRLLFKEENLTIPRVRTALKGQGTVIRVLTFPQMKRADLEGVLKYEVEKYIPFKASEVALDFEILRENINQAGTKAMEVLLVAAKQPEVYELLRIFQNADLEVEVIDVNALALANAVEFICPEVKEGTVGYLDIGGETSTFGIVREGRPVFIRELSFGGDDLLRLLKRKLGLEVAQVFAMQRNPVESPGGSRAGLGKGMESLLVVEEGLRALVTELKISLSYYLDHTAGAEPLRTLFVAGGGARFISDPGFLERELKISTKRPELLSRITLRPGLDAAVLKQNEDLLPVALGLCLRP